MSFAPISGAETGLLEIMTSLFYSKSFVNYSSYKIQRLRTRFVILRQWEPPYNIQMQSIFGIKKYKSNVVVIQI